MNARRCLFVLLAAAPAFAAAPLSPRDEQATFRIVPGWRVELVASEPEVVDPVAMAFDEDGRLYVAEMRGYPNGGVATGDVRLGRIRRLEDLDRNGTYETATTFAEGLRFPTSVMPWRDGLIVADAPDLVFYDGSWTRRVLYTGFNLDNIQQLVSGLQLGLDNWVHAAAGNKGGDIRCPDRPEVPAVSLRGRGFRFKPDEPGSLEPTSGGGQFGLAADDFGNWFTTTNSQHLRHIVLPDHALRRNPFLAVSSTTHDIPDHGAAAKVFRVSPFEAWRVERTTRRANAADAKRFPATELVPGGFITSACSPLIVGSESLVCDPANNLIHRDKLESAGATFVARRTDDGCEFLASTDNWFRPVALSFGPDSAIYVLDFYREAIETPLSLPDDIKAKMNLASRDRGRIWRLIRDGATAAPPPFDSIAAMVDALKSSNPWVRATAHRLLLSRKVTGMSLVRLKRAAGRGSEPQTRVVALSVLDALGQHRDSVFDQAFRDDDVGVLCHAMRLAERHARDAGNSFDVKVQIAATHANPRVRFQAALSLGADFHETTSPLAGILRRDFADPWTLTAALSSARGREARILSEFARQPEVPAHVLTKLATLVGAGGDPEWLRMAFAAVGHSPQAAAILDGLGQGMRNGSRTLNDLLEKPPPELADAIRSTRATFAAAAAKADASSLRLLAYAPADIAFDPLAAALDPKNPPDVQSVAVKSLAAQPGSRPAEMLLDRWDGYGPALRREVVEALCARPDRAAALLAAVEAKRIEPGQIEAVRRDQLRASRDAKLRAMAVKLLTLPPSNRTAVAASYKAALELSGDATRGHAHFKQHCATCHKLGDDGHDVGPDLRATLGTKTREAFLDDFFDPNREVDPRYVNYQVTTKAGRSVTGLMAAETATSVTLRRAGREEDTVLRTQIDEVQATAKSLMPEEFEKLLKPQDVADLVAFLIPAKR